MNFKPKENHIKNQHKIDLEEGKKVRGFSFLERPMQEQVVFLFKDFFPNYEPVESIYSLINDPDLNYFMYFNQKHLLCIIDENMPNIKDIPSVLSNYQDYNILVIINGKIPSGNAWKNKKDYSFVTYWDFLVNLSKNVIFVNKEEFGKNAIYIESLIDDSCDGSLSCFF